MPPPPPHLTRRRVNNNYIQLPPSPPSSPETPRCGLKMLLCKGATFHVPSSPPTENDPVLSIPHLAKRSPTSSQSLLASLLIDDKKDLAARQIEAFEQTFSGARGRRLGSRRQSFEDSIPVFKTYKAGSFRDEALGSSIASPIEKGLVKSLDRALDLDRDSGLGTSIESASIKQEVEQKIVATEDDGLVAGLIQGWHARCFLMSPDCIDTYLADVDRASSSLPRTRQSGNNPTNSSTPRSAIVTSIAPVSSHPFRQPNLRVAARRKLQHNILDPLLREDRFKFFHPLVESLSVRTNKAIKCLRDLEQSLIWEPLVRHFAVDQSVNANPRKKLAVSHHLYRTFGEFSVQLVLDTYRHLSESEQRRAVDRPYDNGYFLDLVQQVGRLSAQINSAREARATREGRKEEQQEDDEIMAYSPDDEVTLEGGLGATGDVAELVRWKNGKGISLRTNEPYEPLPGVKRQHSMGILDDEAERSMARRKKNAEPRIIEMKCSDRTCDKVFTRKCDLAKHEKTHSRPFKCPIANCKYHDMGLPTEKERDRHINDKHSTDPKYYHCEYCSFKTKRDSNCKQHMEKKHGWTYDRVKGAAKKTRTESMSTAQRTPSTPAMDYMSSHGATPESSNQYCGSSVSGSLAGTPLEEALSNFGGSNMGTPYMDNHTIISRGSDFYASPVDNFDFNRPFNMPNQHQISAMRFQQPWNNAAPMGYAAAPPTPSHASGSYTMSPMNHMQMHIEYEPYPTPQMMPTPNSNFLQPHSRNPSIYESPNMQQDMDVAVTRPVPMEFDNMISNNDFLTNAMPTEDFAPLRIGCLCRWLVCTGTRTYHCRSDKLVP